jgi:uncharacterized surface protein with fasciclin (FAS1) repeats
MSDDPKLPGAPGSPSTPPPPPTSPGEPTAPSAVPSEPSGDLGPLAADPTEVMPITEPAAGGGVPPIDPPGAPEDPLGDEPAATPWYKKPGPVAALVIVVLAILGLLAWLIFGGDDDEDEATSTSTFLAFETTDEAGNAIDVGFAVAVEGPADAARSFVWLRPDGVPPGDIAGDSTGADGRVEFEWEPDATVADPATWESNVTVVAQVPPGWTPPGPNVDCVLTPFDGPTSSVTFNIELDSTDDTIARVGTGTFPNQTFAPGDSITCRLVAGTPAPTTVVETTVVETTVPETTVAETTVPETTTAPTTVAPSTTIPIVTVPPQPSATLWDVIENSPDLSELRALIEAADPLVQQTLDDPNATLTLFAPSNTAIENATNTVPPPDLTDQELVTSILLAHVNGTEALLAVDVLDLTEVPVLEGGPQPVDATATPPTIGGAGLLVLDIEAANGVLHVIDAVMPIQP